MPYNPPLEEFKALPEPARSQAVFDYVVAHLGRQRRRSVDGEGVCLYRGPGDCACAAGCLIPDEDYVPKEAEGKVVEALAHEPSTHKHAWLIEVGTGDTGLRFGLLRMLQLVHDSMDAEFVENHGRGGIGNSRPGFDEADAVAQWPARLKWVAKTYGLNASAVDVAFADPGPLTTVTVLKTPKSSNIEAIAFVPGRPGTDAPEDTILVAFRGNDAGPRVYAYTGPKATLADFEALADAHEKAGSVGALFAKTVRKAHAVSLEIDDPRRKLVLG